jgi:simple sugar transport system permease protein
MTEVAAVHGTANASIIVGYGYTGVLVAFLARHHPLAIVPVSILVGGILASGGLLQRTAHLPDATVNVLEGILFVVILASETLRGRLMSGDVPDGEPKPAIARREGVDSTPAGETERAVG